MIRVSMSRTAYVGWRSARSGVPLTADEADEWLAIHAPGRMVDRELGSEAHYIARTDEEVTSWRTMHRVAPITARAMESAP